MQKGTAGRTATAVELERPAALIEATLSNNLHANKSPQLPLLLHWLATCLSSLSLSSLLILATATGHTLSLPQPCTLLASLLAAL